MNASLQRSQDEQTLTLLFLKGQLEELRRKLYGRTSERHAGSTDASGLLSLFPVDEPVAPAPPPPVTKVEAHARAVRKAKDTPGQLDAADTVERRVRVIEPEGLVPDRWIRIGETTSEQLHFIPASCYVEVTVRPKYKDPATGRIHQAPAREGSFSRHSVDVSVAAHVVVQKIVDHLPLYRSAKIFARQGVNLPESTLGDIYTAAANLLLPLYEAHRHEVLKGGYLNVDETVIQVLDSDRKGATHQGYYWVCYNSPSRSVLFVYDRSRGRAAPQQLLAGFQGYLQTDGYGVYDSFEEVPGITLAGCLAHARRKFFEARTADKALAEEALALFATVYAVERHIRDQGLTGEEKLAYRQAHAIPALEALHAWLMDKYQSIRLPSSPIRKAAEYALSRWDRLVRYADTWLLDPDNNRVENSIRPVAVGRKNYLFAGSHDAAQRSAMFYSLLGTCKAHGLEPFAWLSDVLTRLPNHPQKRIHELLPQYYRQAESSVL
jgi:transposase